MHCQFVELQIQEVDPVDKEAIEEIDVACRVRPESLKSLMQVTVKYPAGERTSSLSSTPVEVFCAGAQAEATAGQG